MFTALKGSQFYFYSLWNEVVAKTNALISCVVTALAKIWLSHDAAQVVIALTPPNDFY